MDESLFSDLPELFPQPIQEIESYLSVDYFDPPRKEQEKKDGIELGGVFYPINDLKTTLLHIQFLVKKLNVGLNSTLSRSQHLRTLILRGIGEVCEMIDQGEIDKIKLRISNLIYYLDEFQLNINLPALDQIPFITKNRRPINEMEFRPIINIFRSKIQDILNNLKGVNEIKLIKKLDQLIVSIQFNFNRKNYVRTHSTAVESYQHLLRDLTFLLVETTMILEDSRYKSLHHLIEEIYRWVLNFKPRKPIQEDKEKPKFLISSLKRSIVSRKSPIELPNVETRFRNLELLIESLTIAIARLDLRKLEFSIVERLLILAGEIKKRYLNYYPHVTHLNNIKGIESKYNWFLTSINFIGRIPDIETNNLTEIDNLIKRLKYVKTWIIKRLSERSFLDETEIYLLNPLMSILVTRGIEILWILFKDSNTELKIYTELSDLVEMITVNFIKLDLNYQKIPGKFYFPLYI